MATKGRRIEIVVESESHTDKRRRFNEEEAINEAMLKQRIVAFY